MKNQTKDKAKQSDKGAGNKGTGKSGKKLGKIIVTHSANFHPDDVCAVGLLAYMLELEGFSLSAKDPAKKIKVIRTLRPQDYEDVADFIVDIGGKYSAKKGWFDHHQREGSGQRENGVKYASFGLVWKEFGKKLTGSAYAADWVDRHMVQGIDAMDNGMYLYKPVFDDISPLLFDDYISTVCDTVKGEENKLHDAARVKPVATLTAKASDKEQKKANGALMREFDRQFMRMVPIAKDALRVFIIKSKQKEKIMKDARAAYAKAVDKRVIVSNKYIPTRFDEFKAPEYVEPLIFVYPDLRGGWSAKTVLISGQSYETRILFPESWRGMRDDGMAAASGVPDAIFCHNSGFLAVAKSREGVLELVRKAFKELGLEEPRF